MKPSEIAWVFDMYRGSSMLLQMDFEWYFVPPFVGTHTISSLVGGVKYVAGGAVAIIVAVALSRTLGRGAG